MPFAISRKGGKNHAKDRTRKADSALVALGKGADSSVIFPQPVEKHCRAVHPPSVLRSWLDLIGGVLL